MSRLNQPSGGPGANPYVVGGHDRPQLRAIMIRMFLVILPGQLVGYLIGSLIAALTGAFSLPHGGLVVNLAAAATAGLAVGLATRPAAQLRPAAAAVSALLGALVAITAIFVATARLAAGYIPTPLDLAPGVIIVAIGQAVIGWLCWVLKSRPPSVP
ncbi:hypothetical protein [Microlunatus speluncae]|uniref:hypothetical protein n=1 Tax=Microlunatus speluncae TaxID=2594267 RepID=UPI0012667B1B|nr:hypothetical protein [Microlunatus speluncae]